MFKKALVLIFSLLLVSCSDDNGQKAQPLNPGNGSGQDNGGDGQDKPKPEPVALKLMTQQEAETLLANAPQNILDVLATTPKEYSFFNSDNKNSVAYLGQVHRQVLIGDMKGQFGSLKRGQYSGQESVAFGLLNGFYEYNKDLQGFDSFGVIAKTEGGGSLPIYEGTVYSDIFPGNINLKSKMAGIDNPLRNKELFGWEGTSLSNYDMDLNSDGKLTPHEYFLGVMKVISMNAASGQNFDAVNGNEPVQKIKGAHVTEEGVDLAQLGQKFLHAAVSFSQAAGDYLSVDLDPAKKKGLLGDNSALFVSSKDGGTRPYTVLQHHWDEAFGYFGAARNYDEYTDKQIKAKISLDTYTSTDVFKTDKEENLLLVDQKYGQGDGEISLNGEKNMGMSVNAAKRDLGAKLKNTDFTDEIMDAFLKGRQLVQEAPEDYLVYAQAYGVKAVVAWEKVIATTVVHYINKTIKDLEVYGTNKYKFKDLAKHFGEMKGFAFAFQFNPVSPMSLSDFKLMHQKMGNHPVNPESGDVDAYAAALIEARDLIEKAYGFDKENVEKW